MKSDTQVLYLGRFVSREHFCAFVYNSTGSKLAKSYDEFSSLISSGVWFAEEKDVPEAKVDKVSEEVDKVVAIKSKRGSKCQNLQQQ
jgi:argininosuccinate synthase